MCVVDGGWWVVGGGQHRTDGPFEQQGVDVPKWPSNRWNVSWLQGRAENEPWLLFIFYVVRSGCKLKSSIELNNRRAESKQMRLASGMLPASQEFRFLSKLIKSSYFTWANVAILSYPPNVWNWIWAFQLDVLVFGDHQCQWHENVFIVGHLINISKLRKYHKENIGELRTRNTWCTFDERRTPLCMQHLDDISDIYEYIWLIYHLGGPTDHVLSWKTNKQTGKLANWQTGGR